ncbi:hypothetical protein N1F89_11915, partial [Aquibium sp. A9E412]|nr:hypothetical protein [Aquibium sp. A9E412]
MRIAARQWAVAAALSLAAHAGAALLLLPDGETVEVAGGGAVEIALAGNAFVDQSAAGTPASETAPAEPAETLTPRPADAPRTAESKTLSPAAGRAAQSTGGQAAPRAEAPDAAR